MENNNNIINKFDKNYIPNYTINPVTAAFIALIGIFILYQVGGAFLTVLIFGFNFQKADVNATRLLTIGGQILLMLLPTLILARKVYPDDITPVLRVKKTTYKELAIFVIGFIILIPLLQSYIYLQNYIINYFAKFSPTLKSLTEILDQLDKLVESTYSSLLKTNSVFEGMFVVFFVAVVPAFCEEILFRGFVQKSFEIKYKPYLSIFITSLFFGLYHFNPYGLIALISLGFYFGYAVYKSNSIITSIVLHFLNNFFAVMAFFIWGSDELLSSKVNVNESILPSIILFISSLIIFVTFILYINKNYNRLFHTEDL